MTAPNVLGDMATGASPAVQFPEVLEDETRVIALDIPGDDHWIVRTPAGQREALVSSFMLEEALVTGNEVIPAWSSAALLMRIYGLMPLADTSLTILREMFGPTATMTAEIAQSPESRCPSLVLHFDVPRTLRHLRHAFVDRYVREVVIPPRAPVPTIVWTYSDAVPA